MKTIMVENISRTHHSVKTDKSLGHNTFLNPQTLKHISLELIDDELLVTTLLHLALA